MSSQPDQRAATEQVQLGILRAQRDRGGPITLGQIELPEVQQAGCPLNVRRRTILGIFDRLVQVL